MKTEKLEKTVKELSEKIEKLTDQPDLGESQPFELNDEVKRGADEGMRKLVMDMRSG